MIRDARRRPFRSTTSAELPIVYYVGAFDLPDGNAAAHRVLANAKLFETLGYRVVLLSTKMHPASQSTDDDVSTADGVEFVGVGRDGRYNSAYRLKELMGAIRRPGNTEAVVLYNMPVIPSLRLLAHARRHKIKIIGDIADWYKAEGGFTRRFAKFIDTSLRMRVVNRRLDGLIVISNFLSRYYAGNLPTVTLPPLVDSQAQKWLPEGSSEDESLRLAYAGAPSREKERLDLAVDAVSVASRVINVSLDVVGLTREDYERMYGESAPSPDIVRFHGRVSHRQALSFVKRSHATLVIREPSRLTKAGFPTKFVESITCGVPVIATDSSDLASYMKAGANGVVTDFESLTAALLDFNERRMTESFPPVEQALFDFRKWAPDVRSFMKAISS